MSIGVTPGLTFRDAEAQKSLLGHFTKVLDHISRAKGSVELIPVKVVGKYLKYLLHSVRKDGESLNLRLGDEGHLNLQKSAGTGLVVNTWSQRWNPVGGENVRI